MITTNLAQDSGNASPLRVALVSPPPLTNSEPFIDLPDFVRDSLTYLAGYLRDKQPAIDIRVLDAKFERLDFSALLTRLTSFRPHVLGLSAHTNEIKPAAYVAAKLKRVLPQCLTVVGGVHATSLPEATLREFPHVDVVVVGEGEATFDELCAVATQREQWPYISGLAYRDGGRIVRTPMRARLADQDAIPQPAWDLVPRSDVYWVHTQRGCPFNCVFCVNPNGRIARGRSVERVIAELSYLADQHQAKFIRFGDEIFTVDMDRTHRLLDAIIAAGLHKRLGFDCQTHVRFVDFDMCRHLKEAGCQRIDIGVETGDDTILRQIGKGTTRKMILDAANSAHRAKLPFACLLILGHPNETRETMRHSIEITAEMNPTIPLISIMIPYPGSEVSRLAAEGKGGYEVLTYDWDRYTFRASHAMNFAGMNESQISRMHLYAYLYVYLRNHRYRDLLSLAREHWRPGLARLRRSVLGGGASKFQFPLKPSDYDEVLSDGEAVTPEDIIQGRAEWAEFQTLELVRSRQEKHTPQEVVVLSEK